MAQQNTVEPDERLRQAFAEMVTRGQAVPLDIVDLWRAQMQKAMPPPAPINRENVEAVGQPGINIGMPQVPDRPGLTFPTGEPPDPPAKPFPGAKKVEVKPYSLPTKKKDKK